VCFFSLLLFPSCWPGCDPPPLVLLAPWPSPDPDLFPYWFSRGSALSYFPLISNRFLARGLVIALMMEAVGISETPVNLYQSIVSYCVFFSPSENIGPLPRYRFVSFSLTFPNCRRLSWQWYFKCACKSWLWNTWNRRCGRKIVKWALWSRLLRCATVAVSVDVKMNPVVPSGWWFDVLLLMQTCFG
jgi:hypothetical protein